MASSYTANYGLCQWAPENAFLREEFNQDNEKIDAALKAAEDKAEAETRQAQAAADRALAGLEDQSYNIYNLILQNDYEGKYTGYKKAMLYDGFMNESRVASKSTAILIRDKAARLSKTGQGDITTEYAGSKCFLGDYSCTTGTQTATAGGILTGIIIRFTLTDGYGFDTTMRITHNDAAAGSQTVTFEDGESGYKTITLETPVTLIKGDTFSLRLECNNDPRSANIYLNSSGYICGTILITAVGADSGTLTAQTVDLAGAGEKALVFVRYNGGEVVPSLNGGVLSRADRRTTVEVNGQSCTEDAYEGPWTGGPLTAGFAMSCGSDSECVFYDYAVILL